MFSDNLLTDQIINQLFVVLACSLRLTLSEEIPLDPKSSILKIQSSPFCLFSYFWLSVKIYNGLGFTIFVSIVIIVVVVICWVSKCSLQSISSVGGLSWEALLVLSCLLLGHDDQAFLEIVLIGSQDVLFLCVSIYIYIFASCWILLNINSNCICCWFVSFGSKKNDLRV